MASQLVQKKSYSVILLAFLFTLAMVVLGALAIAPLVGVVFASGFFTGFVLWLIMPMQATFQTIKLPYVVAILAYIIHRTDEEVSEFVPAMEELTGSTAAAVTSPVSIVLVVLSLVWMLSPLLMKYGYAFGFYGAWTLFAGFGIIELAHFVFPLLTPDSYGYFPGMITAPLIAAVGWWGMWRLWKGNHVSKQT